MSATDTLENDLDPTLSHTRGAPESPLIEQTIGDNLDATVAAHPDREALVDVASGRRWTYTQLLHDVDALALALLDAGVATGDRVGIWAPNCPEWTLTQYATAKIGAILVNINPAYRSHELKYVLGQAGITTLIAAPKFKTSNYARMIEQVRGECPDLACVVLIGETSWSDVVDLLCDRIGLLDGVVFSGGEPTLQPALLPVYAHALRVPPPPGPRPRPHRTVPRRRRYRSALWPGRSRSRAARRQTWG